MTKTKAKGAITKVVALTAEEFQKLTPEQQVEFLNKLQATNKELDESHTELSTKMEEMVKEATKNDLPTFEVDADEKNDIEGGTYEFTAPTFTWDDNSVINVRDLSEGSKSSDKKVAAAAEGIIAALVQRKSGIVRRKEEQ